MPFKHIVACVLLPFAAGYYVSYVFRTINALIADQLVDELGLSPADLGLLTSIYFLMMAVVQLPLGALLDRCGPRRVQSGCLLVTATGAFLFAIAESLTGLLLARALIGVGVATALMAGLKAVILWFPSERIGVANGVLVMIGALGAVSATAPAQILVDALGWRGLFLLLAALTVGAAAVIFIVVPERTTAVRRVDAAGVTTLRSIFTDARFWSLAPMSATCIGSSWAIQGLWAAPWLSDVEGFDRGTVVRHLLVMGLTLSASGIALGALADRLRPRGITTETLFGTTALLFMLAQLAIIQRWPMPSYVLWALIGTAGAATVLSYAILPGYFPREASGRANAALNLLHLSVAFGVQWLTGIVIDQWPNHAGRHPIEAYQAAFALNFVLQALAFAWFALSRTNVAALRMRRSIPKRLGPYRPPAIACRYRQAHLTWLSDVTTAQHQAAHWRAAAVGSFAVSVVLLTLVAPGFSDLRSAIGAEAIAAGSNGYSTESYLGAAGR
jgi:predicted MFS family arabinose efflux permease